MKDINEIMPKIPGLICGAVTNVQPTIANINEMFRILPKDKKWHTLFETPGSTTVDGKTILRKTRESMT